MGSMLEINDTLQLNTEQGFPVDIFDLEKHRENPVTLADVEGKVFEFHNKRPQRYYQHSPVRVFFVHNINNKWLFWGHVFIISQTIEGEDDETYRTSGKYKVVQIYEPAFQEQYTRAEAPSDRNFFIP